MNREQYLEYHKAACLKMIEIAKAKNADYSAGHDPFRNFRVVEAYGLSAEQGFITRMSDKMARLANYIQTGEYKVKDESFEDTCFDLANYAILLAGFMASKKSEGKAAPGLTS